MTTEEDALLAAIEAAPRDDAPRLVYADWLQERGQDAKAEYLRIVVSLMHLPEDRAALVRCLALAPDLEAEWRQRVGGRFEVLLEGSAALLLVAHLFQALLKIAFHESVNLWRKGQPVRLRTMLTREDAESFLQSFGAISGELDQQEERPLRFLIRPMEDDTAIGLFTPSSGE